MATEAVTLAKLTTEIAGHLGKELDEPFKRMLASKIDAWRSRLIRNSLQEKPNEAHFFRQTVYMPMELQEQVPACVGAPLCRVLVGKYDIPTPLRYSTTKFDYVGSVDGTRPFREASPGTVDYLMAGKYSSKTIFYTLENRRLKMHESVKHLPFARIDGVFDKPSEVMKFNCENAGEGCDYWTQPYPITGDIAQLVVQSILQIDFNRPVTPSNKEIDVNPQRQQHEPDGR